MKQLLPPSPPLPQRKSGLPDLRKIKPRPGQARGAWGGSRPRLPHELIPFQRDTAQRKFKPVPSPSGDFSARDGSSIIRGYRNGRAIPSGENLHGISKEIQDGLEPGFRLVISSAAKPLRLSIEILFRPTRICAEAKASKGDEHGDPSKL
jgi:hypothetical protein